jgi:aconitate hydratase A / 2-methylisocitrate dehydratase
MAQSTDSYGVFRDLAVGDRRYGYYSLAALAAAGFDAIGQLPFSLKVLLENLLRGEDGVSVSAGDIAALAEWASKGRPEREIAFRPARVLMQDFTGVPAVVDLATMREAMAELGGDPQRINPLSPVDLVIDHSVMVDAFGNAGAFRKNVEMEFARNGERYAFLRWGQDAFDNFRVVPPGTGICHQVNLEYLARVVWSRSEDGGETLAYPDTLVGTDSHTTMVNGLSVLGWGVGGIEAEAAMLGQPVSMLIPEVVGLRMTGALKEGTTATDLVLTVTQMLRRHGVVGKFVEFCGPGLDSLTLADRATIANMAPEYGATCGFFPIDEETLRYLRFTGRAPDQVALVEAYARAQGLWREAGADDPTFSEKLELDLATVEPSLAGPKRPQDRVALSAVAAAARDIIAAEANGAGAGIPVAGENYQLNHGDVVIAAITSCTNTSNPSVLVAAGLLARKAREKGLTVKPWVKTSLAPGSQVVTEYLQAAGLQADLDALGFDLVGYGCTTCIGNSGPLPGPIGDAIAAGDLHVAAVLSGNRNFEGRVNPQTRLNYLASPPLVVAFALAGSITRDLLTEPLGEASDGAEVFLKDVWPTNREIRAVIDKALSPKMFADRYGDVFTGPEQWRAISTPPSLTYDWQDDSSYVRHPPFFSGMTAAPSAPGNVRGARILAMLGDSVTTDHISPAGSIAADSPAGRYLIERGVEPIDFNSYGARRGNHEVMMRGTFANIRIRNEMVPGVEGGVTRHLPDGEVLSIYDAAMAYQGEGVPLVVVAGKEYGTGSSRDWAAKGTRLLGVEAVIVESFERIHRSNLIGMGVLPLIFMNGETRASLGLTGEETFDIDGIDAGLKPRSQLACRITRPDGSVSETKLMCRIDTADELAYFNNGGILHYVLRDILKAA